MTKFTFPYTSFCFTYWDKTPLIWAEKITSKNQPKLQEIASTLRLIGVKNRNSFPPPTWMGRKY